MFLFSFSLTNRQIGNIVSDGGPDACAMTLSSAKGRKTLWGMIGGLIHEMCAAPRSVCSSLHEVNLQEKHEDIVFFVVMCPSLT